MIGLFVYALGIVLTAIPVARAGCTVGFCTVASVLWPLFWLSFAVHYYRSWRAQRALRAALHALYRARYQSTDRFSA